MAKFKKEWERTTRECVYSQLHSELIQAIDREMRDRELDKNELEILICIESTSKRLTRISLMERVGGIKDMWFHTAAIVTPRWLIYAVKGEKSQPYAVFKYLDKAELDHSIREMIPGENGVTITALGLGELTRTSFFIGLGPEPAAGHFESVLKEAIQQFSI